MRNLFLYANLYHNFGFNITHIVPSFNELKKPNKNKYKASSNDYSTLHYKKQTLEEIQSFDWENATGLGAIMGFGKLRALDFDGCDDLSFIIEVLRELNLPIDYNWTAKTGSRNGFHIYILAEEHSFPIKEDRTKAIKPNSNYKGKFYRMELRWTKHLVLPPSLSEKHHFYDFVNGIPTVPPTFINNDVLEKMIDNFCFENGGINTCIENEISNPEYYYGHYLDLAPFYKTSKSNIFNKVAENDEEDEDFNNYDDNDDDSWGGYGNGGDSEYCGACQESPCMCSDREKTSMTYDY